MLDPAQDFVEPSREIIRILPREDERRFYLDDVLEWTIGA